ncbi:MAG: HAMP domain-containing sensor histidine kinase [Pseudomonadota bacterium]
MTGLFRTTTFRLSLIYMGLFSAAAVLLLVFMYWSTAGFMARQTDETLRTDIDGLQEQYRQRGMPGLLRIIIERSGEGDDRLYLLLAPGGAKVAGNLNTMPREAPAIGPWFDFMYERPVVDMDGAPTGETAIRAARGWRAELRGGYALLVGRDVDARVKLQNRMRAALGWGGAATILLGVAGGVAMSRNVMRRIEAVNAAARDIRKGDLSRRVALDGAGDELDGLAANLNDMLDQTERLMAGLKNVSDNIAHDLRSPLTRLRNRIEAVLRDETDDEAYRAALEETIEEADRLLSVFNALLSIARLEAGAAARRFEQVDATGLLEEIAELYAPVAQEAGLHVSVRPCAKRTCFFGSRALAAQALSNLMDNALKYAGAGRIALAADRVADYVELSVTDEGPGVLEADRARVLERFVRLEASRTQAGSGLGLSMASAIAHLHEGRFELRDGDLSAPRRAPGLKAVLSLPASA